MTLPLPSTRPSSDPPRLALMSSEHALASRIRAGDQAAFEELYLAYYEPLCGFVVVLTARPELAEELVQDLLCWIWERRAEWNPTDGGMRGYLFRAARNRALNYLKRQHLERRVADTLPPDRTTPGMGRPSRAPDAAAEQTEFGDALARAVEELTPRCREACVLHWRHGLTYPEVATAMGITVKATEALMTRALKSLRTSLVSFGGN
jgi:RNA polymerase sigma-70 factor, ECF subfamily